MNSTRAPELVAIVASPCGTAIPKSLTSSPLHADHSDSSSEDDDHLVTPLNEAYHHSCEPFLLEDSLIPHGASPSARATLVPASLHSDSSQTTNPLCSSTSSKGNNENIDSSPGAGHSAHSGSSATSLRLRASSPDLADAIMLCTALPTLLDTLPAFDESGFDLYSVSSSPHEVFDDSGSCMFVPSARGSLSPLHLNPALSRLCQSSPPRPLSPLSVYSNSCDTSCASAPALQFQARRVNSPNGSGFLPSTLGNSYSARFPAGHRLRADFVRSYALEGELGSGGYGFVMAARHRTQNHEVAVKFIAKAKIPKHGWHTSADGRKVPKEAVFLSLLNHPGIVKFHELFEDDVFFYLVEELHGDPWENHKVVPRKPKNPPHCSKDTPLHIDTGSQSDKRSEPCSPRSSGPETSKKPKLGKGPLARPTFGRRASHDLFECIEQSKNKRFSEEDAKYVFAQLVDVVDYLDNIGITHCDIKDENVVIDKNMKIKLIDFGSLVVNDPGQPRPFLKRFFGTTAYASPEIVNDRPYQAPVAEVWALGVLLSFLLTGTSPFPTEADKMSGNIRYDPAIARQLSGECIHLMKRCLQVDPDVRATITEVKNHPWLEGAFDRDRKPELKPREEKAVGRECAL